MPHSKKRWNATELKTVECHTVKQYGMPHSEKTVGCHTVKKCWMPHSEKLWDATQ